MDPTAAAAEEAEALPTPMQTWMKVIVVAVVIILAVVSGILGRLWWLRRRARLASGAERAKGTDDSTDTGFPRDAQDTADKVDDVGGVDHWPGRHLKDMAASPAVCTANVAGEPSDDPPVGPQPREP